MGRHGKPQGGSGKGKDSGDRRQKTDGKFDPLYGKGKHGKDEGKGGGGRGGKK